MERMKIAALFADQEQLDGKEVTVCGWAKNIRDSKNIGFIALSDGGCFKTLQVVLESGKLADVLLVEGRPDEDIRVLRRSDHVKLVIQDGRIVKNAMPHTAKA